MKVTIDHNSNIPLYKQIVLDIKNSILAKTIKTGEYLPSMNQLCENLQVSKETVKKAYDILRSEGHIDSAHGKGFFVKKQKKQADKILILFDKLSTYKKELFQAFSNEMPPKTEYTIRLFNQDIDLFEKFIIDNLGQFNYYVITPHLPLNKPIQKRVINILKKIPNRQLVILDRNLENLPGNYISVYQDFENDVILGLQQSMEYAKLYSKINVLLMQGSLYGKLVQEGVKKFCQENKIQVSFYDKKIPNVIQPGEAYFILSGQLEDELIKVVQQTKKQNLEIGKDIGILSYNESALNEIILNGLSVLSTDFIQMGSEAAKLIKEDKTKRIKCNFRFIKRNSF